MMGAATIRRLALVLPALLLLAGPALAAEDLVLTAKGELTDLAAAAAGAPEPAASEPAPAAEAAMAAGTEGDEAPPADAPYIYGARDLRDPFALPAALRTAKTPTADIPPLQQHPLSDFRLVAVVRGGRGTYAMVTTGDGKGYTIRVGTRVGPDGRVRRITKDAVIVEEVHPDEFGELRKSETVLALRPEEVVP